MIARWLFLILLVLNLTVFFWGYAQPKRIAAQPPGLPGGIDELRLVRLGEQVEVEQKGYPAPASAKSVTRSSSGQESSVSAGLEASTSDAKAEPNPRRCVMLGPITDDQSAYAIVEFLSGSGHFAVTQEEVSRLQSGFWVLIPAEDEEAQRVLSDLSAAGLQDVWRFAKGDLKGAISVGLYSDEYSAKVRAQDLSGQGFEASVRPRYLDETTYWVRTEFQPEDAVAKSALEQLFDQNQRLNFPPVACSAVENP